MSAYLGEGSGADLWRGITLHEGPLTTIVGRENAPSEPDTASDPPLTERHGGLPGCIALKITSAPLSGKCRRRKPHDARQEAVLLRKCKGDNIIAVLDYVWLDSHVHILTLPLLAFSLRSFFHQTPVWTSWDLFRRVAHGILAGLEHIHALDVAHRDICPGNIMIDWEGGVKLVDFGISWDTSVAHLVLTEDEDDEWEEPKTNMCCDVGTGPYRAPELLFGPKTYDARAIDLWATGATLAEFFAPLSGGTTEEDPLEDRPVSRRSRPTLFDATRGDLGLIASIWRVRGTPTSLTWPEFGELPDAGKIHFERREPQDLAAVLPGLGNLEDEQANQVEMLLDGLLKLSPVRRLAASDALALPLFDDMDAAALGAHNLLRPALDQYRASLEAHFASVETES